MRTDLHTRAAEASDLDALHALFSRPAVAPFVGRTPWDSLEVTRAELSRSGVHRVITMDGDRAVAYGHLDSAARPRTAHVGRLRIVADGADPGVVLRPLIDLADRWLALAKLEIEVDAEDPVIPSLLAFGFAREVHKRRARRRDGGLVDAVILGRLRPRFVPMTSPDPLPAWPAPGDPVKVHLRHVAPADLAEWAALHRAPSVVWGTLQLPIATDAVWRERLASNTVIGQHALVALHDGRIVGSGGGHKLPFPCDHTMLVGMGVHPDFQGRRVGGQILDGIVSLARDWLGLQRIELEVYVDNPRAIALYRSRGFVEEGVRRLNAVRDGAHVDSLVMAITS